MIDINDIKIEDLQDEARFAEYQAALVHAVEVGRGRDVLDFRIKIQQFFQEFADLEKLKPELFKNYRKIVLYTELESFELITEDLQIFILQKYFFSFAQLQLDVAQKVEVSIFLEDEALRDDKKDTFMAALLQNQQTIGNQSFEIEGRMVRPTIGNWVALYRSRLGLLPQDQLIQMDFCSRDEARLLSEDDRAKLQKVIEVVELLKIPPEREEEVETQPTSNNEVGKVYSPLDVPIKKPKVPLSEVQKIDPRFTALKQQGGGMVSNQEAPLPEGLAGQVATPFRSLADLKIIDLSTVHSMGVSLPDFVERVRGEVQKVYARSPESRPHIVELWRQSPLFHLYMAMLQDSMRTKKPIDEVARMRFQGNQSSLTKEEFDLVASLSKEIQ